MLPSTAKYRTRVAAPAWAATAPAATAGRLGRLALPSPVDLDRAREERRHDAQQRLVVVVEGHGAVALDDEHAHELAERDRRHSESALDAVEPRQRHVAPRPDPLLCERLAHTRRVLAHLAQVADSHRGRARSGHPDRALTDSHLRSDALRGVPVARDREEALARLVEEQEKRVRVAEQVMQPVDSRTDERVEVGTPAQPGDELTQCLGPCLRSPQGMQAVGLVEQLDVESLGTRPPP